jgi:hypothetical protein
VYAHVRHLLLVAVLAGIGAWTSPAAAWIELNPKGLLSTVEVEQDGHATVSHELSLEVRGGPLKELDLGTADPDAELLPDASVTRVSNGMVTPLLVERHADGSLGLEIDLPKGLRGGTYLFKVRYRIDLVARALVHRRASSLEIGWIGPRLDAGLDGARAIFRLPPSDVAPRLPLVASDDPDPGFGVMVSSVHHTPAADEIELVRSHVARGEPVLWRVEAGASTIAEHPAAVTPAAAPKAPALAPLPPPARSLRWPLISGLFGLGLALLAAEKARALGAACRERRAVPRPLIPVPAPLRAGGAGLALGLGLYFGSELEEPTLAALGILLAMALVCERTPRLERAPRGPGRWLSLRDEDAFTPVRRVAARSLLDAGTLRGIALLVLVLAGTLALALAELSRSPYHALLIGLATASAMPLFFTGRPSELARDRVQFSRRFMRDLARALRARVPAKTVAWGRVPDGGSEPDELRVLIQPKDGVDGLVALETGLDPQRGLGGVVGVPFVIVRAKEGSPAQRALPRGVIWARGRKADERVAILSPKLPTVGLTAALVERLLGSLTGQPSKSRRMSSGSSAFSSKLGNVRSPAHAT